MASNETQETPTRKYLVFDIEGNGRRYECTTVHCMWVQDPSTGEEFDFGGPGNKSIEEGIELLQTAHRIVAHNGIDYDVPVLEKLYNVKLPRCLDTAVMSRLLWPDRIKHPNSIYSNNPNSLAAWGKNLSTNGVISLGKSDYSGGWEEWNQEMHDYCRQDVVVTTALFRMLAAKVKPYRTALLHEIRFAEMISEMTGNGVKFDVDRADRIEKRLITLSLGYQDKLQEVFPPKVETLKTPEYWSVGKVTRQSKTEAIKAGAKAYNITQKEAREKVKPGPLRTKEHPFNPGSGDQIAERLREKYGWRPKATELTPTGKPRMDEAVLSKMEYPEAKILQRYLLINKRLSQLRSLIDSVADDGRIYHSVNTIGAVSRRCSHSSPNLGQIPAVRSRFGKQFRRLFVADDGMVLIGADLSGIEIRALANRLAEWDGGKYIKFVLEEDIHTVNQHIGQLLTRDQSKVAFYSFLYGAGDAKIGSSIAMNESLSAAQRASYGSQSNTEIGRQYRESMKARLDGLDSLLKKLSRAVLRGYIVSLDGSRIPIRSEHMTLNTALQSDGAIVAKVAMIEMYDEVTRLGGKFGLHVHDEWQIIGPRENADAIGKAIQAGMKRAGERLGMRIPIEGEYKIGKNWKETH